MSLEAIAAEEGEYFARKIMPLERKFSFVRGHLNRENGSVHIVLEERLFGLLKRRYSVSIAIDNFYNSSTLSEVLLVPYRGHLLFGSMEDEDKVYNYLNQSLKEGVLKQKKYESVVAELNARISDLHSQLYDGGLLNTEKRTNVALLSAVIAGILGLLISTKNRRRILNSVSAAIGSFAVANLTYKAVEKNILIQSLRVKPDDPLLGGYIRKALEYKPKEAVY